MIKPFGRTPNGMDLPAKRVIKKNSTNMVEEAQDIIKGKKLGSKLKKFPK